MKLRHFRVSRRFPTIKLRRPGKIPSPTPFRLVSVTSSDRDILAGSPSGGEKLHNGIFVVSLILYFVAGARKVTIIRARKMELGWLAEGRTLRTVTLDQFLERDRPQVAPLSTISPDDFQLLKQTSDKHVSADSNRGKSNLTKKKVGYPSCLAWCALGGLPPGAALRRLISVVSVQCTLCAFPVCLLPYPAPDTFGLFRLSVDTPGLSTASVRLRLYPLLVVPLAPVRSATCLLRYSVLV